MAGKQVLMLIVFMVLKPHLNPTLICERDESSNYNTTGPKGEGPTHLEELEPAQYEDDSSLIDAFKAKFPRLWVYHNMNLTETLVFWESLACGGSSSFCGSNRDNPYLKELGHLRCDHCVCDTCDIYDDCCLDGSLQRNVSSNRLDSLECVNGTEVWGSAVISMSYFFVSRCPEKYLNVQTRVACKDRKRQILEALRDPPVYSPLSRLSYVNSYCARCHEETGKIKMWTPTLVCSDSPDLRTITSKADLLQLAKEGTGCHVSFSPPANSPVRMCQRLGPIGECNVTGAWQEYDPMLQEACGMYSHVVHVHGQRYRNIFCAMCNGELNRSYDGLLEILSCRSRNEGDLLPAVVGGVVPFSRIFDLTPDTPSQPTSDETECPGNFVFDMFKKGCRELMCSDGRIISNHSCVGVFLTARGVAYRLYFDIAPEKRNSKPGEIWGAFQGKLRHLSFALHPFYHRVDIYEYNTTEQNSSASTVLMWLEYSVIVGKFIRQEEAEFHLLDTPSSSWFVHCPPGRADFYGVHSRKGSTDVSRTTLHKTESSDDPLNQTSIITLTNLSRCNQIELEDTEFTMNSSSGVITLTASGDELGVTEYFVVQDKIRICVNFSGWFQSETKGSVDETEYWLTLISLAVSLSALFVTFLLSLNSKSRNTVPGLITIMLVVTIFLAQGLFLFLPLASSNKWTCQIIGLLAHYSWLVVFAWKNVAAFHMYVAFTQPFTSRLTSPRRVLLKYALYAFGAPSVLVTLYVVARIALSKQGCLAYAQNCFLAAPIDLGLAFVAPVSVVIVINGYCFTLVVYELKKMSEFEKNSNRSNSAHTYVFIKMSPILGFLWVAGFLANTVQKTKALWYLFDALNAGVGVLFLLIQISNRHPVQQLKKVVTSTSKRESSSAKISGRV